MRRQDFLEVEEAGAGHVTLRIPLPSLAASVGEAPADVENPHGGP
jgi:hypothetical protein